MQRVEIELSQAEVRAGPVSILRARLPAVVPNYEALSSALKQGVIDAALRERLRIRAAGIIRCTY